jgi:DNA-binding LytR/AlgR family response regulator
LTEGDVLKSVIDVYIIEDNLSHMKEIQITIDDFSKKSVLLNFMPYPILNYIELYENLADFSFKSGSLFIIDIHLRTYFTGFDLARELRKLDKNVKLVFLTSDPTLSIEAINSHIDLFAYLVKPVESDQFFKAELQETLKKVEIESNLILDKGSSLIVKIGTENYPINISDIVYITSIKDWRGKVVLKTLYSEDICNGKLSDFKAHLNPDIFFLKAKSVILNLNYIKSYNRIEGIVVFNNGDELFVGTSIVEKLNKFIKKRAVKI